MFRLSTRSFARLASSPRTNIIARDPSRLALVRPGVRFLASKSDDPPPKQPIDTKHEHEIGQQKLKSDPSKVSTQSSVRQFIAEAQPASPTGQQGNDDMTKDLRHDIETVKSTFQFDSVPRESRILGLAGTLPYLGTSLSTVYLAWDLNQIWPSGNWVKDTISMDHETAKYLLSVIEPVQLGYGAVIISFLGAIHWGLEYAEKQPLRERTRFRYGMGLASSIIAWPTLFLPIEYALTTQFMAFVGLYFADAKAATRGWAPHWYGTYRFMLTAMVGLAIFLSLVGRAKISQGDTLTGHGLEDRISSRTGIADTKTDWAKLEQEEKKRLRKKREEEEKKKAEEEKKKAEEEKKEKKSGKSKKSKDSEESSKGDKSGSKDDKSESKDDKAEKSDDESEEKEDDGEDKESQKSEDKSKNSDKDEGKDEKKDEDNDEEKEEKEEKADKDEEEEDKKDDKKDKEEDASNEDNESNEDENKKDEDKKEESDDKKDDNDDSKSDDKKEKKEKKKSKAKDN